MQFYNLSIDIRQRKCIVVGGGKVALRKVRKLCAADADVIVVSPDFLTEFYEENITIFQEKYKKTVLQGAVLVFAATSDLAVNQQICKDAEQLGIWANSVNGVKYGSFIIPATCKKGNLTIGITTDGKAPSLSKELRKYFQEQLAKIETEMLSEIVALRAKMVTSSDDETKQKLEQEIAKRTAEIITKIKGN